MNQKVLGYSLREGFILVNIAAVRLLECLFEGLERSEANQVILRYLTCQILFCRDCESLNQGLITVEQG